MAAVKKNIGKKVWATNVTGPDGQRVYVKARSKEEFDRKVAETKLALGAGVKLKDETSFEEYAWLWCRTYKAPPRLRENSYQTLVSNLENHVLPSFRGLKLKEIRNFHVQQFLTDISGLSKSTQSKCFQILRGILDSAVDNDLLMRSPIKKEDRPGGQTAEEEEPLTDAQARQLLEAVRGTRAYLFCLSALSTGLRRGEILGLMWEDIDMEHGLIRVRHNKTFPSNASDAPVTTLLKSDASRRDIPLPLVLRAELERLIAAGEREKSAYVLHMEDGRSLTKNSFMSLWRIVTVRCVSEDRPVGTALRGSNGGKLTVSLDFTCHPHQLRHTFCTQMFEHGADIKEVQYQMGHSTPDITMKIYNHYRQKARQAETAAKVDQTTAYLLADRETGDTEEAVHGVSVGPGGYGPETPKGESVRVSWTLEGGMSTGTEGKVVAFPGLRGVK